MRIVLDTNVYIGAALQGELTEDILEEAIENPEIVLISSEEIFLEIKQKLQEKFHWPTDKLKYFLDKKGSVLFIQKHFLGLFQNISRKIEKIKEETCRLTRFVCRTFWVFGGRIF